MFFALQIESDRQYQQQDKKEFDLIGMQSTYQRTGHY